MGLCEVSVSFTQHLILRYWTQRLCG